MGIEDGLGEAADQAKKIVTGTDEDKQNKQQDDDRDDFLKQAKEGDKDVTIHRTGQGDGPTSW
jgi:hypothetical protein